MDALVTLRYASYGPCPRCKRDTPHTKAGACVICNKRVRKAKRAAKRSTVGSPLVEFAQLRGIADQLWSVVCRAEATACAYCQDELLPHRLQWCHHYTRGLPGLRFHPLNWSALCSGCHRRFTPFERDPEWARWLQEVRLAGGGWERLQQLRLAPPRIRSSDVHLLILDAQRRVQALPPGVRRVWAEAKVATIMGRYAKLGVRKVPE